LLALDSFFFHQGFSLHVLRGHHGRAVDSATILPPPDVASITTPLMDTTKDDGHDAKALIKLRNALKYTGSNLYDLLLLAQQAGIIESKASTPVDDIDEGKEGDVAAEQKNRIGVATSTTMTRLLKEDKILHDLTSMAAAAEEEQEQEEKQDVEEKTLVSLATDAINAAAIVSAIARGGEDFERDCPKDANLGVLQCLFAIWIGISFCKNDCDFIDELNQEICFCACDICENEDGCDTITCSAINADIVSATAGLGEGDLEELCPKGVTVLQCLLAISSRNSFCKNDCDFIDELNQESCFCACDICENENGCDTFNC
jgi:hypothetical protein